MTSSDKPSSVKIKHKRNLQEEEMEEEEKRPEASVHPLLPYDTRCGS